MEAELFCFSSETATHRLILLHGWGADAEDLLPFGMSLVKDLDVEVELISLNAPNKFENGGGRNWYNLFPADWAEAHKAMNALEVRLRNLDISKIPLEKTVLLGFSQGGAMAVATGVNLPLAGLVGCSSYPHPNFMPPEITPPIYLTHGRNDNVVPLEAGMKLLEIFTKNKAHIDFNTFEGGHEIPQKLYGDIRIFLKKCLT